MEPTKEEQEAIDAVYKIGVDLIVNQKKTPGEAIAELQRQGLDEESATIVIENVNSYALNNREVDNSRAYKDLAFGAMWCIGGIVATAAEIGYIFWGAILFGAIQFLKGLVGLAASK